MAFVIHNVIHYTKLRSFVIHNHFKKVIILYWEWQRVTILWTTNSFVHKPDGLLVNVVYTAVKCRRNYASSQSFSVNEVLGFSSFMWRHLSLYPRNVIRTPPTSVLRRKMCRLHYYQPSREYNKCPVLISEDDLVSFTDIFGMMNSTTGRRMSNSCHNQCF